MKHLAARPKSKELAPLRTVLMKRLVAPNEPAPLLIVFMKHFVHTWLTGPSRKSCTVQRVHLANHICAGTEALVRKKKGESGGALQ
jgi:hypothetical protein